MLITQFMVAYIGGIRVLGVQFEVILNFLFVQIDCVLDLYKDAYK